MIAAPLYAATEQAASCAAPTGLSVMLIVLVLSLLGLLLALRSLAGWLADKLQRRTRKAGRP